MEQAARSGKQNIIEGVTASETSDKTQIKLLGVAKASLEELLADYEDFLREENLPIYTKSHPKITGFRQLSYKLSNLSNLSDLGYLIEKPALPGNPTDDANFLLTLCHQETYLLHKFIESSKQTFIAKGGFSENLLKERLKFRREH